MHLLSKLKYISTLYPLTGSYAEGWKSHNEKSDEYECR
jgi:hypothetical protein